MAVVQKQLELRSAAFAPGAPIPRRYAARGEGENVSPPVAWSHVPAGTRELVLLCEDPDAPRDTPFAHWVVYAIPPTLIELPEGFSGRRFPKGSLEAAVVEGRNDFGEIGWGGPLPPRGHGVHRYVFSLLALDAPLGLQERGATRDELLRAVRGHVLDQGELIGTYERR